MTPWHYSMLGDHNHWRKTYAYEGSLHIPLIVKLPASVKQRVKRGKTVEGAVELRDILPTFMEMAGVKPDMLRQRELYRDTDEGSEVMRDIMDKYYFKK